MTKDQFIELALKENIPDEDIADLMANRRKDIGPFDDDTQESDAAVSAEPKPLMQRGQAASEMPMT